MNLMNANLLYYMAYATITPFPERRLNVAITSLMRERPGYSWHVQSLAPRCSVIAIAHHLEILFDVSSAIAKLEERLM
jgi:hypothetical protein